MSPVVGPVDVGDVLSELCRRLGVEPHYVAEMTLTPFAADIILFKGDEGRCRGRKYVEPGTHDAAVERLSIPIDTREAKGGAGG